MQYVFDVWDLNELRAEDSLPRNIAMDAIETYLKEKVKLSGTALK